MLTSCRYNNEAKHEYPQPDSSCLVGSCIGLLAAVAVSCSRDVIDLVSVGPEIVVLAFRLGFLVQEKTSSITTGPDGLASYSSVVTGIEEETALHLLHDYCESEALPTASRIYASAVSNGSITISGAPAQLEKFFSQNPKLKSFKVPINGLFHSSSLYEPADVEKLVGGLSASLRGRVTQLDVISNADERDESAPGTPCEGILRVALSQMLIEQLRWDLISQRVTSTLERPDTYGVSILPFASGNVQGLVASVRLSPGVEDVEVLNTASLKTYTSESDSEAKRRSHRSKLAIIGYSGRFPEADDNEAFWQLLASGLDVVRDIPKDRFDPWLYYDPTTKKKNTSGVTKGCFVRHPDLFDARFFGMSPREAEQADPAQRLALMTAYEAMEMAGFVPDATPSTQRDRIGVFYGTASDDYRETNSAQNVDTYFVPGGSRAFLPGRVNYFFNFSGPSFDVDTACSSGLAAMHIACNSLWAGDCDVAIAGGTNILTNPDNWAGLDRAHFLSRTGNCKTFDDGADGYCRSESVATVLLKRFEDAQLDGDPIYGTILGAYTNHSAESVSITRPHSGAQQAIFSRILTSADVDKSDVSYVEMHGTGTQHGDACEMDSVLSVFAPGNTRRNVPMYIGSAKANIGHAESASGIASLIKVLMMMEKSVIPPHVGIKTKINRHFPTDLAQRNVHIAMQTAPWPRPDPKDKPQGRRAFVNNFGAAGGNSSVLVEDAPLLLPQADDPRPLHVVAVSAKSQTSLTRNVHALIQYMDEHPDISVGSLSYTTTARRVHYNFRTIVSGVSVREIRNALQNTQDKEQDSLTAKNNKTQTHIGFCFTGQGSQYLGMGRKLLEIPQFQSLLMGLENLLRLQGFQSILSIIDGSCSTPMELLPPVTLQLAITCLQMALGKFWKSLGISPRLVIGHSLGEYAALNIAGVLSDADTIYLVGTRALLLEEHCTVGTHTMLAVKAPVAKVTSLITSYPNLEIACINAPEEIVISGPNEKVESFANTLARLSIKGTQLKVQFAFHSRQVEPMLEAFRESCRAIVFKNPSVPILSPLLKKTATSASDFGSPAVYLSRHCQETVSFYEVVNSARQSDTISDKMCWIEIGPHPVCTNMLKATLGTSNKCFTSLRRGDDDWRVFTSTLAALYKCGLSINWNEYHSGFKDHLRVLKLPAYQWELKSFWIPYAHDWCLTKGDPPAQHHLAMPLPIVQPEKQHLTSSVQDIIDEKYSSDESWITAQSDAQHPDIRDVLLGHLVNNRPVSSSALYADMALTLFNRLLEKSPVTFDKSGLGIEVSNMVADKSLILNDEPVQLVEMKASVKWSTNLATFTMSSISQDGKMIANHAKCTGSFTEKNLWTAEWKRRDFLVRSRIKDLHQSVHDDSDAVHMIKTGMFYKLFAALVDYQPSFKGCREAIIRSEALESTSKVKFNTPPGIADKFTIPPYWCDGLGQITGFTMNANDAVDSKTQVFINHGWENMRIAETLSPETTYQTYLKMDKKDETSYIGDVYIFNTKTDQIIAMYDGVTFSAVPRKILDLVIPAPKTATSKPALPPSQEAAPRAKGPAKMPELVIPQEALSAEPPALLQPGEESANVDRLRAIIAEEVGAPVSDVQDDVELSDLGVDSLLALTMSDRILEDLGVKVDSTSFLAGVKIKDLIQQVCGDSGGSTSPSNSTPPTPPRVPIEEESAPSPEEVYSPMNGLSDPSSSGLIRFDVDLKKIPPTSRKLASPYLSTNVPHYCYD